MQPASLATHAGLRRKEAYEFRLMAERSGYHRPVDAPGTYRLDQLRRLARAFDEISDLDADGARYRAEVFVTWLAEEAAWDGDSLGQHRLRPRADKRVVSAAR